MQAYSFVYDRGFHLVRHLATTIGAEVTALGVSKPLQHTYGDHPAGFSIFVRLRPI